MNHRQRLDAIEQRFAAHPVRCEHCIGWPPTRIVWTESEIVHEPDPTPARCHSCGFEPLAIRVRYVDDWRSV